MKLMTISLNDSIKLKRALIRANRALAWAVVAMPMLGWTFDWPWLSSTLIAVAMALVHGLASLVLLPIPERVHSQMWRASFLVVGNSDVAERYGGWTVRERFWWHALRTALAYLWPWLSLLVLFGLDAMRQFSMPPVFWLLVVATIAMAGAWTVALPFVTGVHLSEATQAALARWAITRKALSDNVRQFAARLLVTAYFAAIYAHVIHALGSAR